jgi:hypothetical protein
MKNVTISLDEGLLKATRPAAAREGISFQEYVRRLLKKEAEFDPVKNLERLFALADKLDIKTDGKYPTREEIYDRPSLRGFKRDPVRSRQKGSKKRRAG